MSRMLVVDDDREVRVAMARILEHEEHSVAQAENGQQAVRALREFSPDLILTDINMPEMDGIEFITHLRTIHSGVPIIAISGGGALPKKLLLSTAGMLGALETLEKPFTSADLLAAVRRAMGDEEVGHGA